MRWPWGTIATQRNLAFVTQGCSVGCLKTIEMNMKIYRNWIEIVSCIGQPNTGQRGNEWTDYFVRWTTQHRKTDSERWRSMIRRGDGVLTLFHCENMSHDLIIVFASCLVGHMNSKQSTACLVSSWASFAPSSSAFRLSWVVQGTRHPNPCQSWVVHGSHYTLISYFDTIQATNQWTTSMTYYWFLIR